MRFTSQTSSGGVLEQLFSLGEIPGVLWTPEGAGGTRPVILMGHGGGQHKKAPAIANRARRFVAECGFAVVAPDVPGHGDRPKHEEYARIAAGNQARVAAGEELAPLIASFQALVARQTVPEWQAVLDAVQGLPHVGAGPVGYWGVSLGCGPGAPVRRRRAPGPGGGAGPGRRPGERRGRRADPGFGRDERNAEPAAQRHTPIAHRAGADAAELPDRVQDRPPFRHGLAGYERLEASDQRSQFLSGLHAGLVLGRDPAVLLILGPIAVAGHVRRHHRETALGHEAAREGHEAGSLLVLPAAVAHHDQGTGAGGTF